jgi:hypothetical protein
LEPSNEPERKELDMGSKPLNRIAVALSALVLAAPAVASEGPIKNYSLNGATGDYAPQLVHKNYSLNGATGDYRPPVRATAPRVTVVHASNPSGFAWTDAAIGAAVALMLVLLAGITTSRIRRRRIQPPARPRTA